MDQLSDSEKIATVLHSVAGRIRRTDKETYYQSVVRVLATTLDADCVLVATVGPSESDLVKTIAVYAKGKISENIEYKLAGTPCAGVFNKGLCIYERNVAEQFPDHKLLSDINADAYIGAPLWDSKGNATGLIAILNNKPFESLPLGETLIQVAATAVAAELERELEKEKYKQKKERCRQLFNNAFDAVYLVNQSSRKVIDANASATRMLGFTHEQFLDKYFEDLFEQGQNNKLIDDLKQGQLSAESTEYEALQMSKDGLQVPVAISACVNELDTETLVQFCVRDLRAQKQLEEQILHSHKMEAVGTLAGGIAHDFNNVLMGILGFSELAMRESRDSSVNKKLENIVDACQHARSLVSKILSFSKKTPEMVSVFSLADVIRDTVVLLRTSLPPSIAIEVNTSHPDINIKGDLTQIEQVIINLCTNAASALRNGRGNISIKLNTKHLSASDSAMLDIPVAEYACLEISDNGAGMREEVRRRIFEPFFTTKKHGEGSGLGLTIVYGVVKNHRGAIKIKSEIDLGTTATIFLPLLEQHELAQVEIEEDQSECVGVGKVLVVDDDPKVLMILEEALKLFGYQPIACSSAVKALNIFREAPESFVSIITDQAMPGMSGDQLIKEIRENRASIPVVLCTGYADFSAEEWKSELNLFACLKKPFTMSALSDVLTQIIADKQR